MKNAKVCIIARYVWYLDSRLRQQINTLKECNVPCDVICTSEYEKSVKKMDSVTIHGILRMKDIKLSFFPYMLIVLKFALASFFKLLSLSFGHNYKVIIVHTLPEILVFIGIFNKIFGSKIILDGRDLTVELLTSRWHVKCIFMVRFIAVLLEKLVTSFCDEVITASNGFKRVLILRGVSPQKIRVINNTASEDIFKYDSTKNIMTINNRARMIYHGTVSKRFGLHIAIKSMSRVIKKIPESTLHIFGWFEPVYLRELEEYIRNEKLDKWVRLYNRVSLEDIYKEILTMDIGVVPYRCDNFMNLALSTKTFEYIAAGLPVVASRLQSTEELFDDSCIEYFKPGDYNDLAEKIIYLCHNPDIRESKREKAIDVFNNKYTSICQNKILIEIISKYIGKDRMNKIKNVKKEILEKM